MPEPPRRSLAVPTRAAIHAAAYADEDVLVRSLLQATGLDRSDRTAIHQAACRLVTRVRQQDSTTVMEAFLAEFGLSTDEGIALMCLAEALLRVPDPGTMDQLIAATLVGAHWNTHEGHAESFLVNASTWALMLTGRMLNPRHAHGIGGTLRTLLRRVGEPVVRLAVVQAMREMGRQFVMGQTIEEALARARDEEAAGYTFSYDMLGEAARTADDARRYQLAYADAIVALGRHGSGPVHRRAGISVKLSALCPRYEPLQRQHLAVTLLPRIRALAELAADAGIGLNIDAEEMDRQDLSLDILDTLLAEPSLKSWDGLGVVVQAYGRRALPLIHWLGDRARDHKRRLMVRLVKGAYWDTEIKRAQVAGLDTYPVFTRKAATDVSYLACSQALLAASDWLYPQFATHNAHTATSVMHLAARWPGAGYEFQRLHGMGEVLHQLLHEEHGQSVRVYAPVGVHEDLLAYLVRRLLENGANSSFVHQLLDKRLDTAEVAADPCERALVPSALPAPRCIHAGREVASGVDFGHPPHLASLLAAQASLRRDDLPPLPRPTSTEKLAEILHRARQARHRWARLGTSQRAQMLDAAADSLNAAPGEFLALLTLEARKTLTDALAEVRETVDLLRYYAGVARTLPAHSPHGVFACIAPWNFPLAIFTGQVAAALVTGNCAIAKAAEQTPRIGDAAIRLLHAAGVPSDVLQVVHGDGPGTGARLSASTHVDGVVFTGSLETARRIHRSLAAALPPGAPLIAETGGINAMVVDSTALLEHAVRDIVTSAFASAGQRCSALRVVYVQADVAPRLLALLTGAMAELRMGTPSALDTDIGPLIDAEATADVEAYLATATVLYRASPPGNDCTAPAIVHCDGIGTVPREVFGPVLHWCTFLPREIDGIIDAINASGHGLTFALHTRLQDRVRQFVGRLHVGNCYINRNQIGAVVGSQPFGGEGLSGTGPKAGGPHYLRRFLHDALPVADASCAPMTMTQDSLQAVVTRLIESPRAEAWRIRDDRLPVLLDLIDHTGSDALARSVLMAAGELLPEQRLGSVTGEENTLTLHPLSWSLCLGAGALVALAQLLQSLAAGTPAVVCAPEEGLAPLLSRMRDTGLPFVWLHQAPAAQALVDVTPLPLVAFVGEITEMRTVRRLIASREGAIVRFSGAITDPLSYCVERHVCTDTTASGGNTALMLAAG
ncbi:MAG: L-glutamate gamma-semialdehyde dehydrogenase [Pseudomonadales bacterium]|nr:L-glutamate gamma-semialdehyde dehydrogenase [Pseudomonadales bacterium]